MDSLRTILVVDDERSFLSSMRRFLYKEPFHVMTAESGVEALEILRDNNVSIIITDYMMPDMNGLSLVKIIRTEYPHVITIMLTALYELDIALKAVNDLGIYKFFLKPVEREKLLSTLQNTVSYLDSEVAGDFYFQHKLKTRAACMQALEQEFPGITKIDLIGDEYDVFKA